MRRTRHLAGLLALLLALAGCERPAAPVEAEVYAMGTLVRFSLYGAPPDEAAAAVREAEDWLQSFGRDGWAYGEGELAQLNAALARGECRRVSDDLAVQIRLAREVSLTSGGRFDPAVGPLIRLWGFDRAPRDPDRPFPQPDDIRALLPLPPIGAVTVSVNGEVCGPRGLFIDLGGIGKGYAVDRVVAALGRRGIPAALVNAGGNLKTLGDPPGRAWHIGIRDPYRPGVMATLDLAAGEAVSTSGDYERMFDHEGTRYHHILDPRTGYPVAGLHAVTVVHADAAMADAASTALFVAGPEQWRQVAAALGIERALVVQADGTVAMTPAMVERVRLVSGWAPPRPPADGPAAAVSGRPRDGP
ncbi:MAG TPA: FAD:protein FMN transferase [Candidatus Acidoferrales bacterium]|nr:FAD:protein FMN transferase [Candidatus Acidoferrales bacterium]